PRPEGAPQGKSVSSLVPLNNRPRGATVPRRPWLFPERIGALDASPADDQPIDQEEDEGTDHGADEARALAGIVPAYEVPEPAGEHCARDPEKDRDQAAAGIAPRH